MSSKRLEIDLTINQLIGQIKRKIETLSGYQSENHQIRMLLLRMKEYECPTAKNMISLEDFQLFLFRLNCVSQNLSEIEELFSMFDDSMSGRMNYLIFAYSLYNAGPYPLLSNGSLKTMNQLRNCLIAKKDFHEPIRFCWKVAQFCKQEGRDLSIATLSDCLFEATTGRVYRQQLVLLLEKNFVFENNFKRKEINVNNFLRCFQVSSLIRE
jgi:hypothetical protein